MQSNNDKPRSRVLYATSFVLLRLLGSYGTYSGLLVWVLGPWVGYPRLAALLLTVLIQGPLTWLLWCIGHRRLRPVLLLSAYLSYSQPRQPMGPRLRGRYACHAQNRRQGRSRHSAALAQTSGGQE